ncbi:hypothetical protein CBL_10853 [Carabus blaptoides fortunei]
MNYLLSFTFMLLVSFNKFENTSSSVLLNGIDEESMLTKFIVDLLYKYEDFQIVFHVNQETEESVNDIVQCLYKNQTIISFVVYNYDKLQIDAEFVRPEVPNIVHLLFAKNVAHWHWLNGHKKINYNDVIVFVAENNDLRSHIVEESLKIIKLAGKILLLESAENRTIHLYETCFYCGNMSKKFVRLSSNTTNHLLLNDFRDLNGHLLHLIFIPNFPFLHCSKSKMVLWKKEIVNICSKLIGIEGHMIRLISRKMNFNILTVMLEANTHYVEMLKYVNAKKADVAFGDITLSLDRNPWIQFTTQFHLESHTFLYMYRMSLGENFQMFLEPFQPVTVWLLFLLCLIFCHMPFEQSVSNINLVYRGLKTSGLILALWWWCCLVLCTMYKSMMLSVMVHPAIKEPEDLSQLVTVGYKIVGNKQSSDIIKDMLNVSDAVYSEAMNHIEFGVNTCDTFSKVINERSAMLDEQSTILFGIRRKCPSPKSQIRDKLRVTRYPIRISGHAWATQLGAPYRHALDRYLGLILSGGLFEKWKRDDTYLGVEKPIPFSREKREQKAISLPLLVFYPLLAIYGVGMLLSTLCLIMEILCYAYHLRQRPRIQIKQIIPFMYYD